MIKNLIASGMIAVLVTASATSSLAMEYPLVIQSLVRSGSKVERTFPAVSGLTGWVLSQGNQYALVFTTADGKTLVVGPLFDEQGQNLTETYREKYFPKPDYSAAFKELENSQFAVEGAAANPKSTLYVFIDPNCPYCHLAWKMMQPYEAAGLQVRWVLVGYLRPSSLPKAIGILSARDRTAAFRETMQKFGEADEQPKDSTPEAKPEVAAAVNKNLELMDKFGIRGTPGIVWKDRNGKVAVKGGLPNLSDIPAMTGIPEQKIDDPELLQYR